MSREFQFSFEPPQDFTIDDFRRMLSATERLSPLDKIAGLSPGGGALESTMSDANARREIRRLRGIIDSMTAQERRNPSESIDASRRQRIAAGAGADPAEIAQFVTQFDGMVAIMKRFRRRRPGQS